MSLLLATVQAIAPVVHSAVTQAPAATPAPQVVTHTVTVVKTVPAVSANVYKAVEFGLLVLSGVGASSLHQLILRDKLSATANRLIWGGYGLLIAAVAAWLTGDLKLTWDSVLGFAENFVAVAGASSIRYNYFQLLSAASNSGNSASSAAPSTDAQVIEQNPPAQAGF